MTNQLQHFYHHQFGMEDTDFNILNRRVFQEVQCLESYNEKSLADITRSIASGVTE